jgi:hypothetical protein
MEAIKLKEYVSQKGLVIDREKLKKFENRMVDVVIYPSEDDSSIKDFHKYAGTLSEYDAEVMLAEVEGCRKIDSEGWM